MFFFFFSSRRRHTRSDRDWSSDVCSSDLEMPGEQFDSLRGNMCLHAQAVVLVLERGLPHPLENLFEGLEALCEHRSDRAEQLEMNLIESVKSFRGEQAGDLSEVRRDVVGPFAPVSVHFRRKGG